MPAFVWWDTAFRGVAGAVRAEPRLAIDIDMGTYDTYEMTPATGEMCFLESRLAP
jgi:hypothetical protein